jgi:lysophospholipase L1-like esterase
VVAGASAGGVLGLAAYGARVLLQRQAAVARRIIGKPLGEAAPDADKVWKKSYGATVDLVVLGDSIAAGLGAERRKDTLGGRLARGLAKATHRSVRLRTAAVVGSESSALRDQLATLPADYRPDVAVVVVGGNDVTHRVPVAESVAHLAETVEALRARGAEVVVGTCPDLGAIRSVAPPLRQLAGLLGRRMARAQARAVQAAGGTVVDLGEETGAVFRADAGTLCYDGFHPSADGYRVWAHALFPAVEEAALAKAV